MTGSNRRRLVSAMAAGIGAGLLPRAASAQSAAWPNRPVKLVVSFVPGGLTDAWARVFAEQFTARYNQPCLVENRPGAGGNIAIETVLKAPPDGYTFLVSTTGVVWQNRVLYSKLPFDLGKDITPVCNYPAGPNIVGVHDKLPVRNYKEFIEYARRNPSTMGSYSPASFPHMLGDHMAKNEGAKLNVVHYKGEGPMWVDVAGGQVQIAVGSFQAFNAVAGKGVRAIAATGFYRSPKLPDVLTLQEQGAAGDLATMGGGLPITAHSQVPQDILQKMAQVAVESWDVPKIKALRDAFAIPEKVMGLEDTRRLWRDVAPLWIKKAAELGVKLD